MSSWPAWVSPPDRVRLQRAWLHRLRWEYDAINRDKLRLALRPAVLEFDAQARSRLGCWHRMTRTIAIAECHVLEHAWDEVIETLKHEMAHQYADEVLQAGELAHGPAFSQACRKLGVADHATRARGARPADAGALRVLQKVRKLLALAGSPNVHEAELAMATANRLLLEHNLEPASVDDVREYGVRRVGSPHGKVQVAHKLIASILSEYFFVECLWTNVYDALADRSLRQLELLGTHDNVELAHYVHDFLHLESERLWQTARSTLRARDGRARREYVSGVLLGFRDKLASERITCAEQGLVWTGDPGLKRYFRERHPHTRQMTSARVGGTRAHAAGRVDGGSLRLRKGIESRGTGGGLLGA